MLDHQIEQAMLDWGAVLGNDAVDFSAEPIASTLGSTKRVPLRLTPKDVTEVISIVEIAGKHKVPLYPISTGNNWGYGSKSPVIDGCVVVDLSKMDKVLAFDAQTGIVTLEPGVTQRKLNAYLQKKGCSFLIPVTGAGPDCSLIGNALERGYGITPYADHFAAVMSLEAVLPDGTLYTSMLDGFGGGDVNNLFKWGVGPYVDGIFSQGNFGIVTKMTIALAPIPERMEAFFFSVKRDDKLELAVEKVRKVLREVGTVTGSINLMNKHRVLSMSEAYPWDAIGEDGLIPDAVLQKMMRRNQVMDWTGVGAIYGNKRVVAAVKKEIKKILSPVASRLVFLTPGKVSFLAHLLGAIPVVRDAHIMNTVATLKKTMDLFAGEPSEIALPLAYWKSGEKPKEGDPMDPDRDGCGLIWYSPLIPMRPDVTREFVEMASRICRAHKIEPLITLTSVSDRCWDSTVPILFDKRNQAEIGRAHACYEELLDAGRKLGFVPYRLGIQSMGLLADESVQPKLLRKLKNAIDPDNIIAPGRYGL
ncbi:FAD-binding oxidoreductase [Methylomonas sp. HYX-M1]|uniref:FAD-binding oxidoreductase n=1 Tax=Methylomonas sp. HYX-M1 TaxID=3139307 RepID=UPI00345B88B8